MEITGEYVAFSGILIPKNARNRYGLGTLVPYTCVYMQVFYNKTAIQTPPNVDG